MSKSLSVGPSGDVTFDERQRQLDAGEHAQNREQENEKKSPYKSFAQLNLDFSKELSWLISSYPKAASILVFLIEHMDGYNALVCSNRVIQEALGISLPTVTRAIKILKDNKFVKVAKAGTTNVYYVNSELVWKSWGKNLKYSEFSAKIIISESEQDVEKTETKTRTKRIPTAVVDGAKNKKDNTDDLESGQSALSV